jgi:poly-beta-1,6-N-acetyl-D-glucosamine synthase
MLFHLLSTFAEAVILVYALSLFLVYILLSILSGKELLKHFYAEKITNYDAILSSPFAPTISIIAPAYNESLTIVENIRALLSLYYPNFEIIIVNDGSKDDTLARAIEAYDLEKVPYVIDYKIECKEILDIYKSKKKAFNNLTVLNKINGGKADALNAGINIAKGQFFTAIDVDSIIDPYALQKMVLPFLTATDKRVIATGGVIRIANSCKIKDGQLIEINVPDDFLPRCQVIEYNRAFLLGRLAWSRLDGLLLISGALGLFDKEIAIASGGYLSTTVGHGDCGQDAQIHGQQEGEIQRGLRTRSPLLDRGSLQPEDTRKSAQPMDPWRDRHPLPAQRPLLQSQIRSDGNVVLPILDLLRMAGSHH